MKTKNRTVRTLPKGISRMPKHVYDGLLIRIQKRGYRFRRYVSIGRRFEFRRQERVTGAIAKAQSFLWSIKTIILDDGNWRNDKIIRAVIIRLSQAGWSCDIPK